MDVTAKKEEDKFDAQERFWLGPVNPAKHIIYYAQRCSTEQDWLVAKNGDVELDPNYSDYSIRLHCPKARSMSFIYRTIAILPKSKVRAIAALLNAYLERHDAK